MSEITESGFEDLKLEANKLGVQYRNNISAAKLLEKVNAAKVANNIEVEDELDTSIDFAKKPRETTNQRNMRVRKACNLLHRVNIVCHNPNKKKWTSEIFNVSNSVSGSFKRTVPFSINTHVPTIILNVIKEREYLKTYETKDNNGNLIKRFKNVAEFSVTHLDPLTKSEIITIRDKKRLETANEED